MPRHPTYPIGYQEYRLPNIDWESAKTTLREFGVEVVETVDGKSRLKCHGEIYNYKWKRHRDWATLKVYYAPPQPYNPLGSRLFKAFPQPKGYPTWNSPQWAWIVCSILFFVLLGLAFFLGIGAIILRLWSRSPH